MRWTFLCAVLIVACGDDDSMPPLEPDAGMEIMMDAGQACSEAMHGMSCAVGDGCTGQSGCDSVQCGCIGGRLACETENVCATTCGEEVLTCGAACSTPDEMCLCKCADSVGTSLCSCVDGMRQCSECGDG